MSNIIFGENTVADVTNVTRDTYMDETIPGYKFSDDTELKFKRTMDAIQTSIIKFNLTALQCVDPSVSIT